MLLPRAGSTWACTRATSGAAWTPSRPCSQVRAHAARASAHAAHNTPADHAAIGRARCNTAAAQPGVDFSLIGEQHDTLWTATHRETREEIQARGRAFMEQLLERPEQHIAVVSHSSFLHFMLTNYGHGSSQVIAGELHKWYENCEMRSVVVVDEHAGAKAHDPAHFPGFASAVKEGPQA